MTIFKTSQNKLQLFTRAHQCTENFDVLKSVKFFSLVLFETTLCSRVGVLWGFY